MPIKSKLDIIVDIDLVDNLICIILQSSCEDNDFIVLGHQFYELDASRSHQKEAILAVFDVMNKSFVEVQN